MNSDLVGFEAPSEEVFESRQQEAALLKPVILDTRALALDMMAMIRDVQEVLYTTHGIARVLLQKFDWNNEQLMNEFYSYGTVDALLTFHNIDASGTSPIQEGECLICLENSDLTGLKCFHLACFKCWKSYLKKKIDRGQSEIECMSCNLVMDDAKVEVFIGTETLERLKKLIIDKYVTTNEQLKWCPGVNCGRVVKRFKTQTREIKCSCGYDMCFDCGDESHFPADCRHLKTWAELMAEYERNAAKPEDEPADDIKNCPNCNASLQNVRRHDKVKCTVCRHKFCWKCLDKCFKAGRICAADKVLLDTERKAARFARYQETYLTHMNTVISPTFPISIELNIGEVMDLLKKARQILMTSTIFLYFMTSKNCERYMYNKNLKMLEKVMNDLQRLFAQNTNDQNEVEKALKSINKYISNLMDIYKDANERGLWGFEECLGC